MENEDSRNALYCDPNAYIQSVQKREKCEPRKVVFQEPYEQLPNFYINNNFIKRNCNCVKNYNAKDCNCDNDKHFINNHSNKYC